jgi:hypothetical protein
MQSVTFNVGQTCTVTVTPEDSSGNPGLLGTGDVPAWSIDPGSPQTGLTITPAANGLSASLVATVPGTYQVNVVQQNSAGGTYTASFDAVVNEQPATQDLFSFSVS